MKAGNKFLLRLKDSTPDFLGTLCADDNIFPLEVFYGLERIKECKVHDRIFKNDEKELSVAVIRDGFQVVITSNSKLENFATDLASCVPLSKCLVYAVEHRS
jgi:hypothetical protein